ncbi:MAG: hypothetical protein JW990_00715 [Thermoleophilia bacterium]|nr:hypothetical protein [Thermoleophilia bacterium]
MRDQPRTLGWILAIANVLNVADYGLTMNALANGFQEANPIMRSMIEMNPALAGALKMLVLLLVTARVWQCRRYRKALIVAIVMLTFFAAIFAWHLFCLALMI